MADPVRIVVNRMDEVTEQIVSTLAVNITAELIERTPVDTGWARANWVPGVGAPAPTPATPGSREARSAAAGGRTGAQQAGIAATLGYRLGPKVFISNGVPYVVRLNEGSSNKAPEGFVQDAIMAGLRSIRGRSFT